MEKESRDTVQPDLTGAADNMYISDYTYHLPDDRIAHYPLEQRDQSKLLVYSNDTITHRTFSDLPSILPEKSLLVFNDTRVIPARAFFKKATGATIEILLLHPEMPSRIIQEAMLAKGESVWECMIGNKKRWKSQDCLSVEIAINGKKMAVNAAYADYDQNLVRFCWDNDVPFVEVVEALGEIPLPPYLNRKTEETDAQAYQTVYAHHKGAVAAPTAGLHFTENTFDELQKRNIRRAFLTLHVGAGTFLPVKVENVREHRMHSEQMVFSRQLIEQLLDAPERIIPVGTTSLRSLESLYWFGVKLHKKETDQFQIEKLYPYEQNEASLPDAHGSLTAILHYMDAQNIGSITGHTEIFIFPGYTFRLCQGLVTNFHQPGSTLILLVAAFVGEAWKDIYAEALEKDYRFLSYGDSSLLWPSKTRVPSDYAKNIES